MSEARSLLTGRIVDTYTNIVTVKLFARARDEDAYVREAVDHHTGRFHESLRLNTLFALTLIFLNALLITGTGAFAIVLWRHGHVSVGTVAGAAHDHADHKRLSLGGVAGNRHLRKYRRRAGRHDDDRTSDCAQ